MRTTKREMGAVRFCFAVIASVLPLMLVTGCMTASDRGDAQKLSDAGKRMGVLIRSEGSFDYSQFGSQMSVAPAENLETIPATRYTEGVDIGVSYLNLRGATATVPAGFYKLRAIVPDATHTGKTKGRVQLVNLEGRVVADLATDFDIRSLTAPSAPSGRHTLLSLKSGAIWNQPSDRRVYVCGDCPNGVFWCSYIELSWFDSDF